MYFDIYYVILVLPTVILALIAQASVKSTFNRYATVFNRRGMTGRDVAEYILHSAGIYDVTIQPIAGSLTDNYNPTQKTLNLSESVYGVSSIAAAGVAAHECGHAIQHAQSYYPLQLRNAIIPITNIGSKLSMPLILIGLLVSGSSSYAVSTGSPLGYKIIYVGIMLYGLAVLFQVLTVPVEFNASKRALTILSESQLLMQDEVAGARKVLSAAAMTYVAAMAQSLASMLRLILIFGNRGNSRGRR